MSWIARLNLDYSLEAGRSVARHAHDGPLRILQSLYPEGDRICHNVLVHPPSGLVGGDTLDMHVTVGQGAQGLVTTPGATRFYRSEAGLASRYVSGYLLTQPPPGKPRLIGADASHAWASVYLPELADSACGGWLDLDPTNDRWGFGAPGEDYVLVAWGRDFADVSPLRGVLQGGESHALKVEVTVMPMGETPENTETHELDSTP